MGVIGKEEVLRIAFSMMEERRIPDRSEMKRAATATVKRLLLHEGLEVEELLEAMEVDYHPEEPLDTKIDKALWQIFAQIVVAMDKERME
jgi:hypothetical protein